MKTLLTVLCVVAVASVAWADKPVQQIENPIDRVECSFENVAYDWNFAESDQGFTTGYCDYGCVPTWVYRLSIWATSVENPPNDYYPNDACESLISPSFIVDDSAYLVELFHSYVIETSYDGGNLSVNGAVVAPMEGYPDDEISDSTAYYAWCVDGEPGFTGSSSGLTLSCFDLSAFMGEEVQLFFDFGSDSIGRQTGWGIVYVRVGGDVVANDGTTWSAMKGLYK